jgi:hypothetical protein
LRPSDYDTGVLMTTGQAVQMTFLRNKEEEINPKPGHQATSEKETPQQNLIK